MTMVNGRQREAGGRRLRVSGAGETWFSVGTVRCEVRERGMGRINEPSSCR